MQDLTTNKGLENKRIRIEWEQALPRIEYALTFFINLFFDTFIPKYPGFSNLLKDVVATYFALHSVDKT